LSDPSCSGTRERSVSLMVPYPIPVAEIVRFPSPVFGDSDALIIQVDGPELFYQGRMDIAFACLRKRKWHSLAPSFSESVPKSFLHPFTL